MSARNASTIAYKELLKMYTYIWCNRCMHVSDVSHYLNLNVVGLYKTLKETL